MKEEISKAIIPIEIEVEAFYNVAMALSVTNEAELPIAIDNLGQIKALQAKLNKRRKELIAPLRELVDFVNGRFEKPLTMLEKLEMYVKGLIMAYRKDQEEAKAKLLMAAAKIADISPMAIPAIPSQKTFKAEAASLTFMKIWRYRLADFGKVPDEWKILDEAKIGKAIKQGGVREIPGLEIFQEEVASIR